MVLRILGGRWKGRLIQTPPDSITRPTQGIVRAALFNICQGEVAGARVLDLCAGSGAVGLEALSRGATLVFFVEMHPKAARVIRHNLEQLASGSEAVVLEMDAERACRWLLSRGYLFDLIYVDPPYAKPEFIPDLLREIEPLLALRGQLFVEEKREVKRPAWQDMTALSLRKSRTFGGSILHQFVKGESSDVERP